MKYVLNKRQSDYMSVVITVLMLLTLGFIWFWIGYRIGVTRYKQSCEVIGYSTTNKWRECQP